MAVDVSDLTRAVEQYARDVFDAGAEGLLRRMKLDAPRDTGRMERSGRIDSRSVAPGMASGTAIFDAPSDEGFVYASITDTGHRKQKIVPVRAKALRFNPGGGVIFRATTKGQRGTRWFSDNATETVWTAECQAAADVTPTT